MRYYRPKPYLLVTPTGEELTRTVTTDGDKRSEAVKSGVSDRLVSLQLEYLPDFAEEYSISVTPGLGSANVSFKLEDGWKLTEMNQELDSQFDENISALSELVGAASGAISPTGASGFDANAPGIKHQWFVTATNVPIGYYEAVVNRDPCGSKRLYGWRYVGFAPFNSCPTDMSCRTVASCEGDPHGPIYGLAFEQGVMRFKQLNTILRPNLSPTARPVGEFDKENTAARDETARRVIIGVVRKAIQSRGYAYRATPTVSIDSEGNTVTVDFLAEPAAEGDAVDLSVIEGEIATDLEVLMKSGLLGVPYEVEVTGKLDLVESGGIVPSKPEPIQPGNPRDSGFSLPAPSGGHDGE